MDLGLGVGGKELKGVGKKASIIRIYCIKYIFNKNSKIASEIPFNVWKVSPMQMG